MTAYHYNGSSQVVQIGDRVQAGPVAGAALYGHRGELMALWYGGEPEADCIRADVRWDDHRLTTTVPLWVLDYLPPERELAEGIVADAERGPTHTRVIHHPDPFEMRSEALRAAVAALMHANPAGGVAERAGHIVAMANTFTQFLTQPGPDEAGTDPFQA